MTVDPEIDVLLDRWRAALGAEYLGYRNHAQRVARFCRVLQPCDEDEMVRVRTAAAFHDLGIWTDRTFDYLEPSIGLAREYLDQAGLSHHADEVAQMIAMHHRLRPWRDAAHPLVEVFRRADLIDLSWGWIRFGLPAAFVRDVQRELPSVGFHRGLLAIIGRWWSNHPLRPVPALKW